ncbi:hypothetical protein GCM10010425_82970 [Streptomyces spororaveus]|uniref:Reverse transcriptase domain-containing protein n=3 Tax=Streptomyces TaxID=1883 RepID=A0ABQ3T2Q7_9ACTN|nr:hypothetical protein Sspor_02300 [Streptomyces spororaveus]
MPKDAPANDGAPPDEAPLGPRQRVSEMQAKLHRWAAADPGRRFDDLFNLVHDPATLTMAFDRVAGNQGARTAGIDDLTVADVEEQIGVLRFLDDLRARLRSGAFRALPVREKQIPKPGGSGKLRRLGIPTVADRVVQAALKLVLEPIFEADFKPVSYGFRPMRRAQDAIAEIHSFGTKGYRWVLDADIEACFDEIDHAALMDRVRRRIKDKKVLGLVKAFLKAGILTEIGEQRDTLTGTPQGGILSPLLANIALSVLDEHVHGAWEDGGVLSTDRLRRNRRRDGLPRWRIVRYADDFAVMVHGTEQDTTALRDEIAQVLAQIGLRLSPAKTRIVHLSEGFDFLGFRIQWRRKRGTNKWHVYTDISRRAVRSVKMKVRALTHRLSQHDMEHVLTRLNLIRHGWAQYFKYAIAKRVFAMVDAFTWWRVVRMLRSRHDWSFGDVRRRLHPLRGVAADHSGRGQAAEDRGYPDRPVPPSRQQDPQPMDATGLTAGVVESPLRREAHGGFGEKPGETEQGQPCHRVPGLLCKNGCTARNDVLIAEAIEAPTVGAGCSLTGGVWHSYYDDVLVQGPSGVDIDHMVPLAEVHDSGGYGWTTERRRRYANDLGSDVTLVGVTARSNRQKSDQDPATWMPMPAVHCRYLGEWVATKHRWGLAVDPAEREALLRYAADCPNARITYDPAA